MNWNTLPMDKGTDWWWFQCPGIAVKGYDRCEAHRNYRDYLHKIGGQHGELQPDPNVRYCLPAGQQPPEGLERAA